MIKVEIIGYEVLTSSKGEFYKVYAVSDVENPRVVGRKCYESFVDKSHFIKNNVNPASILGMTAEYYNVKDGDRWKMGITFKNSK